MNMLNLSATNTRKLAHLQSILAKALEQCLKPGFYGSIVLKAKIQDGTIQVIGREVKQVDK